ncbi:pyocin knob domain-containing S74 family peptidase [Enterobacter hormaechei]
MLYNTGTIAINGNTATGTGTNWTAPASQVRAGQTIIVMSNPVQLFQISSVNSATSMTVTPAASPALSGQKYGILVSDNISVDGLAQAMSQLIKEYDENIGAWETFATTSANQSITVTINGTPVTIPCIGKLAQKGSNGALAVADGGTGATKAEDARTNLGLGSSATKDVGTSEGSVQVVGGLGGPVDAYRFFQIDSALPSNTINLNDARNPGVFPNLINFTTAVNPPAASGYGYIQNYVRIAGSSGASTQFMLPYATQTDAGRFFYRGFNTNAWAPWKEIMTSAVSDKTMKNIGDDLDPEEALMNICRMEFKHFTFKDDDTQTPRRGVISQQIETIDPEYVKEIGGLLHLDQTPMLLDALAAIKALTIRVRVLEEQGATKVSVH